MVNVEKFKHAFRKRSTNRQIYEQKVQQYQDTLNQMRGLIATARKVGHRNLEDFQAEHQRWENELKYTDRIGKKSEKEAHLKIVSDLKQLQTAYDKMNVDVSNASEADAPKRIELFGGAVKLHPKAIPGLSNLSPTEQQALVQKIESKLTNGKSVVGSLLDDPDQLSGSEISRQTVADIAWYLRSVAESKVGAFVKGAITIPDPGGNLVSLLDGCKEKYARDSSHLKSAQKEQGGTARGIDFYEGTNDADLLLPYGMNTFLYQKFTTADGEQCLFIKTETESARISPQMLSSSDDKPQSRPVEKADVLRSVKHGLNFVKSLTGKHDDGGEQSHREKVPADIVALYYVLMKAVNKDKMAMKVLQQGDYKREVFQMLSNVGELVEIYEQVPGEVAEAIKSLSTAITERDWELDSLSRRLGNEVVLSASDMSPLTDEQLDQIKDLVPRLLGDIEDLDQAVVTEKAVDLAKRQGFNAATDYIRQLSQELHGNPKVLYESFNLLKLEGKDFNQLYQSLEGLSFGDGSEDIERIDSQLIELENELMLWSTSSD